MKDRNQMVMEKIAPEGATWIPRKGRHRKFGFISFSAEHHAKNMADAMFPDDGVYYRWFEWMWFRNEVALPILIGMFHGNFHSRNMHLRAMRIPLSLKKQTDQPPAILWWIGSDLLALKTAVETGDVSFFKLLQHKNILHICESEENARELKEYVKTNNIEILPLPVNFEYEPLPLPPFKRVAVYSPMHRRDFYYQELCLRIAKLVPQATFLFYGLDYPDNLVQMGRLDDEFVENTWFVGKVQRAEMEGLISTCCTYLRLTQHDGVPQSILEFGLAGRQIVFNHPDIIDVQHPVKVSPKDVKDKNAMEKAAKRLAAVVKQAISAKGPDMNMHENYKAKYGHARFKKSFNRIIKKMEAKL